MDFRASKAIAANISKIAQYTAELELIKEKLIERWPHRVVFLKQQIAHCESVLAQWFQQPMTFQNCGVGKRSKPPVS